ncbi:MAG: hypothetical protein VKP62_16895 [Candidatus Sericytochromatia bacterium]|nr:hypothetical protein [Candidatus Sericytochromatia bacterium]
MHQRLLLTSMTFSVLVASGCADGPTQAVLRTTELKPASAPQAAGASIGVSLEQATSPSIRSEGSLSAPAVPPQGNVLPQAIPLPPADSVAIPEAPQFDLAVRRSTAAGEAESQNILDPWRPYGVGIMKKTATSVTIAWRTDADAKGIVYFGKTFGLERRGYDGVYHLNKSEKLQQVTIEGLSRFRSYTFTVVGLGPLGMQFPSYPFQTRTHLF